MEKLAQFESSLYTPQDLPPLRMLLVMDNLVDIKPQFVLWLCAHGIMPLYTPVGGSWLNMTESIQRILKRRALRDIIHKQLLKLLGGWKQLLLDESTISTVCLGRVTNPTSRELRQTPFPWRIWVAHVAL